MTRNRHHLPLAITACVIALATPVAAQRTQRATPDTINLSVNYSFPVTGADQTGSQLTAAIEAGRRQAYEMAGQECKSLLATIASTCRLSRLNVSSRVMRRREGNMIEINATANFDIEPK